MDNLSKHLLWETRRPVNSKVLSTSLLIVALGGCSSSTITTVSEQSIPQHVTQLAVESKLPAASKTPHYIVADAHLHYVDFLQQTDGLQKLIEAMDNAGVSHAMISGMGVVKKWEEGDPRRPSYYLSNDSRVYWYSATDIIVARALAQLPANQRRRFHAFISGINATDKNAINHIRLMMDWYPDIWEGIGELFGHHDDLTALTYGEVPRPNSEAMQRIFEFAAEHDLPVSIHNNITSVWEKDDPLFLQEFIIALKRNPKTRFIWCHAGISRRLVMPKITGILRELLQQYSNLWIDLSWVVYDDYIAPLNDSGEKRVVNEDWIRLIEDFPDHFMIGSDIVGHVDNYVETIRRYDPFLTALTPQTAQKVAHDSFLAVLPRHLEIIR